MTTGLPFLSYVSLLHKNQLHISILLSSADDHQQCGDEPLVIEDEGLTTHSHTYLIFQI